MAEPVQEKKKAGWRDALLLSVLALIIAAGAYMSMHRANGADDYTKLPSEPVAIQTKDGKAELEVEIAKTPMDIKIGLMFRKSMEENHGMLFQLGRDDPHTANFWMKETYIPLDLIFIAKDGRIVNIHRNAKPLDLTPIPSLEPVTGVIEVNAGIADALGIAVGDKVLHPYFE
ncbi:MAG: DUF192 domain-containing protein [Alphaproteobacteria bacterium]